MKVLLSWLPKQYCRILYRLRVVSNEKTPKMLPSGFLSAVPVFPHYRNGLHESLISRKKYLLAAVDYPTKWVETRAVKAATAANAANCLQNKSF